jgi:hypothetical protein
VKVRWEACRDSALAATWSTWVAVFAWPWWCQSGLRPSSGDRFASPGQDRE